MVWESVGEDLFFSEWTEEEKPVIPYPNKKMIKRYNDGISSNR